MENFRPHTGEWGNTGICPKNQQRSSSRHYFVTNDDLKLTISPNPGAKKVKWTYSLAYEREQIEVYILSQEGTVHKKEKLPYFNLGQHHRHFQFAQRVIPSQGSGRTTQQYKAITKRAVQSRIIFTGTNDSRNQSGVVGAGLTMGEQIRRKR